MTGRALPGHAVVIHSRRRKCDRRWGLVVTSITCARSRDVIDRFAGGYGAIVAGDA